MNATTTPRPAMSVQAVRVLAEYDALRITTAEIRKAEATAVDPATGRLVASRGRTVAALYRSRMVTALVLLKLGVPQSVLESVTRG